MCVFKVLFWLLFNCSISVVTVTRSPAGNITETSAAELFIVEVTVLAPDEQYRGSKSCI